MSESYDQLVHLVSDYFLLKRDLVRVEAEVYEFGKILQAMLPARADKFKAALWQAWYQMQTILKSFSRIKVTQQSVQALAE